MNVNDKTFQQTYRSVLDFNTQLKDYVLNSGQLNLDESLNRLYSSYELKLRKIFEELKNCKSGNCPEEFKQNFEKLRSDISKQINK
jgi:hypothetical protein